MFQVFNIADDSCAEVKQSDVLRCHRYKRCVLFLQQWYNKIDLLRGCLTNCMTSSRYFAEANSKLLWRLKAIQIAPLSK